MNSSLPFDKIGKAVAMLDAQSETEKLAAIGAVERLLKAVGAGFVDLGDAISRMQPPKAMPGMRPPKATRPDWKQTARWCAAYGIGVLTDRELEFVADLAGSKGCRALSIRQEAWLTSIMSKLSMRGAA